MKVVLFCGGLGTRLREYSDTIPKPLVPVGPRPIVWHLMKYYAHFGHKDFILCLGYKGELIKEYFLNYNECMSNDFTLSDGGRVVKPFNVDIADWKISFVDTGMHSNIGQRLTAVREHLAGEELFLANYSDGLSDAPLPDMIDLAQRSRAVATFISVKPTQSFHAVQADAAGCVKSIVSVTQSDTWVNGGYFVLRNEIFDHIRKGEELVEAPFHRLAEQNKLFTHRYTGFWACMDTFKDKMMFDERYNRGDTPWTVWRNGGPR